MADNFEITSGSGTKISTHQNPDLTHEQKIQITAIPSVTVNNFPVNQLVNIDRTGRIPILKTNTLVTSTVTADQVVMTYTVTTGKTLWLEYYAYDVRLTALLATASILGTMSLETPSGTKVFTSTETNPTTSQTGMRFLTFSEPIPITAGTVIRVVVTPAAIASMTWIGNFGGYEI